VIREKAHLVAQLAGLRERLHRAGRQRVRRLAERLADFRRRRVLADPARPLRDWHRRLDDLGLRLHRGLRRRHGDVRQRLDRAARSLRPEVLRANLRHGGRLLAQLGGRLDRAERAEVTRRRRAMEALAGRLDTLSPLACLARGYAICALPSGEIVTRAAQVGAGREVSVRLREGSLDCRVETVRPARPEPGSDGAA
jgi:exodeoxyribonuclease VII large subunit